MSAFYRSAMKDALMIFSMLAAIVSPTMIEMAIAAEMAAVRMELMRPRVAASHAFTPDFDLRCTVKWCDGSCSR